MVDTFASMNTMTCGVGTPGYMAPEAIEKSGGKPLAGSADVYAFGIMLWSMVTTEVVWWGDDPDVSPISLMRRVLDGDRPPIPPNLDETGASPTLTQLAAIMRSCWSPEPEERPSFKDVMRSLQEITAMVTKPYPPPNHVPPHRSTNDHTTAARLTTCFITSLTLDVATGIGQGPWETEEQTVGFLESENRP